MEVAMKLVVKTDILRDAVAELNTILVPATTYRAISFILMKASKSEGLILQATDYEINLKKKIEANIVEEGAIGLPGKFLNKMLSKYDTEEIEIEQTGSDTVIIKSDDKKVTFACLSESEYPIFPKFEERDSFILSASLLKENMKRTLYGVSKDTTNMILRGSLWEIFLNEKRFNMISTDTHRLVVDKMDVEFQKPPKTDQKFVIPEKLLTYLVNSLPQTDIPVSIVIPDNDGQIVFLYENTEIIGKLIVGDYPDYEGIIPEISSMKSIILQRADMLKAIDFVALLAEKKSYNVNLDFNNDILTIYTDLTEVGEAKETVNLGNNKETIKVIFNINYLRDAIVNMDNSELELYFEDERAPMLMKPKDIDSYFTIIMPIRPIE
jgi:DNA polymerase-3 subunit beta